MKLIIQPDAGIKPLLTAVRRAKRTIDLVIFRFDLGLLEAEIEAAVRRGVVVRALITYTNRGGDKGLRKLEQRMLAHGVQVCRTQDDLVRYHGKVLIVDRRRAYILGFNYTAADLKCRSFGVIVRSRRVIKELLRLFDSDANRNPYTPMVRDLVISPENARRRLEAFLSKARKTIDIYDPQVSDDEMLALLQRRVEKGVRVRIIGKLEKKWSDAGFELQPFAGGKLHVRAIIRDGRRAFVGSQSLRKLELDERREVGIIVREPVVVRRLQKIFEFDWRNAGGGKSRRTKEKTLRKAA